MNDFIYAVVCRSSKLLVFETQPSYHRQEDIIVRQVVEPHDLAADPTTGHLYVADRSQGSIVKIEIFNGDVNEQIIDIDSKRPLKYSAETWPVSDGLVRCISITKAGRILVIADGKLITYNNRGEKLDVFSLDIKGPRSQRHVIETPMAKTYICCYSQDETPHCVSEINKSTTFLKEFGGKPGDGPDQLNWPAHLVQVEEGGSLLVANKNRVLALDRSLHIQRILFPVPQDYNLSTCPWRRLWYTKTNRRLLVAWGREDVFVYSV